jgi:radical SAM protein with 4Fe4S-binding SPASM domain
MTIPSISGLTKLAWRHPRYVEHLIVNKLKFFSRYKWLEENVGKDDQVPPPVVYKLVLTYKCDLRCTMCYEWGDAGWCKQEAPEAITEELSWNVVENLFSQFGKQHPSFILIGGEPLLYSNFKRLAETLKENRCFAVTCTNGTLLHRFKDVSVDNPYLTYLVSLDGLRKENDQLRGKGVYERVVRNIKLMKSLKRPPYIGIQFTIRPENVGVMYEFCREMVKLGVDWILLNLCWFVSEEQAREYEEYMQQHFAVTPTSHLGYLLPYNLDKEEFIRQYERIKREKWPIPVSCYLEEPEDIHTYVDTPQVPPRNTFCYKQWLRMDITPDGAVTPCVLYPDLSFGNLNDSGVMDIWNSPEYARFRELRREEPLPICSKCNALYLYDAKRKIL